MQINQGNAKRIEDMSASFSTPCLLCVCLTLAHCLCSFSLPLIFSGSPSSFYQLARSLTLSLFPSHNICFLTSAAKGLAGASHPQIPSVDMQLEDKRGERADEKFKLWLRCWFGALPYSL